MTLKEKERDIIYKEKQWEREKELVKRELELKQEKREVRKSFQRFKLSTSKFLIIFLFLNCTFIELFTGWVTAKSLDLSTMTLMMPDFTPLVTLIGAVVSEVIGFAIYSLKSMKENTTGGIVYETALAEKLNKESEAEG